MKTRYFSSSDKLINNRPIRFSLDAKSYVGLREKSEYQGSKELMNLIFIMDAKNLFYMLGLDGFILIDFISFLELTEDPITKNILESKIFEDLVEYIEDPELSEPAVSCKFSQRDITPIYNPEIGMNYVIILGSLYYYKTKKLVSQLWTPNNYGQTVTVDFNHCSWNDIYNHFKVSKYKGLVTHTIRFLIRRRYIDAPDIIEFRKELEDLNLLDPDSNAMMLSKYNKLERGN